VTKSILVTGGAGFIGHHFVDRILRETNWNITLIDRLDTSGNLNRLADIGAAKNDRVKFVFHDLRASMNEQVMRQVGKHDYVVHMAAGTHVDRSIDDPMAFVMDNVVATCTILEYARKVGCEKFLYFSTDEVFGPAAEGTAFKEWDRYNSGNPYSATKAGGEELALAYGNTYGLNVIISHTMNVVGARQHWEKFVPLVIGKVMRGEKVYIHSDKTRTKPGSRFYIDAKDVALATHLLLDDGEAGKYNIVGAKEIDNLTLARQIAAITGKRLLHECVDFHSSRPGHDLRYALDGTLMREQFGFAPVLDLDSVVKWYLENPNWLAPAVAAKIVA
jgi:dTDP-glucose 4,6-dehydratase